MVAKAATSRNTHGGACGRVRPAGSALPPSVGTGRMASMSHDSTVPDSPEAPERRTDRALEALQYEEKAGLGFRRRTRTPMGDPYAEPERYQIDREPTAGELWAGMLGGIGAVLGFGAIFYKPLLLGNVAVIFAVLGSLGDGAPSRVGRAAILVAGLGTLLGMLLAIFVTKSAIW